MFCGKCGKELQEGALFCPSCGSKQASGNASAVVNDSNPVQNQYQYQKNEPVARNNNPQNNYGNQQNYYGYNQQPNMGNGYYQVDNPVMRENAPHIGVSFGGAIKLFFKNYANFRGRSSRSEYWWVMLFNAMINILLGTLSKLFLPIYAIYVIVSLALLIPGLSLCIRRLHDIGKAWYNLFFALIPLAGVIILIVFFCKESDGDNQWGYRNAM